MTSPLKSGERAVSSAIKTQISGNAQSADCGTHILLFAIDRGYQAGICVQ